MPPGATGCRVEIPSPARAKSIYQFLPSPDTESRYPMRDESAIPFATKQLAKDPEAEAPDGAEVRILHQLAGGSFAHFSLPVGRTSRTVTHRTVAEIWYFLEGEGEMWHRQGDREEVTAVRQGISVTIPLGTHFQFRNTGLGPLSAVAVTMPPWPGEDEAITADGPWEPA